MLYLILEIIFCLLLAAIFGFIIGWYLKAAGRQREITQLEKIWKANLYSKEEELKSGRETIEKLTADLNECRESARKVGKASTGSAGKVTTTAAKVQPPPASRGVNEDEKDDLKKIWGIGKVLEKLLNREGIYRFSQVAQLDDAAIDALAEKIGPFRNRIRRDDWVGGAKEEFFKKYGKKL